MLLFRLGGALLPSLFQAAEVFVLGEAVRDVQHGQHGKDIRLQTAAEQVEIQGKHGGQTHLQEGELPKEAGQSAEDHAREGLKQSADKDGNDRARQNVSVMTERHGDGGCHLADDVERRDDAEALAVLNGARLHLVEGDEGKDQNRPSRRHVDVRGGREESKEGKEAGEAGKPEDRRHERGEIREVLLHVALHQALRLFHQPFGKDLPPRGEAGVHAVGQKEAKPKEGEDHGKGVDLRLGDNEVHHGHGNFKVNESARDHDAFSCGGEQ